MLDRTLTGRRMLNGLNDDSKDLPPGSAEPAVSQLESTPEFQTYARHLRDYVKTGEWEAQLGEATPGLVAVSRRMEWGPTTILKALHRADVGVHGHAMKQEEDRRYSKAFEMLLDWYYRPQ